MISACVLMFSLFFPGKAFAGDVLGVHLLHVNELDKARELLKTEKTKDEWTYVTIPLTLHDLEKQPDWQRFFDQAKAEKFLPIVRLATRYEEENGAWAVPTHKDIVDLSNFLLSLRWPKDDEKLVIVFNEPNHAKEWGGIIDPVSYARTLQFTADWLHSERKQFVILPAGLDLAASNTKNTQEAFAFMKKMLGENPDAFRVIDGWNSHSYPNPGFSASPYGTGKNSLRGYQYELAFVKEYVTKDLPVYITETGWVETQRTVRWLPQYYLYAMKNIWSDPRIRAVTPFVLNGSPGAFEEFSFYDAEGKPTQQFYAFRKTIESSL